MGGPPAAGASTSSAPPAPRRRSARLMIGPPRRDDQDQPPRAPSSALAATSSASPTPKPRRRSTRLVGARELGDKEQPPRDPSTSAPAQLQADADEPAASPAGLVGPRRSGRIRLRVRGLPSAAPTAPRRRRRSPTAPRHKSIEACVEDWRKEKAASGAPEEECVLAFIQKRAPRKVECLICSESILPDQRIQCSVNHCKLILHKACSEKSNGCCPRHICFYCKTRTSRHRVQRTMPVCTECLLQQNRMVDSEDLSKAMICWSIWPSSSEDAGPADDIKEAFRRLPLPYTDQEFSIAPINKQELESERGPPPYIDLKRNVYIVKNKGDRDAIEGGCMDCDHESTCQISCPCRSLLMSCSRACHCSVNCSNKPFRKEKKIQIIKTQPCGWGAIALETIEKDDFVIEFIGEVIDDTTCEDRLRDMKQRKDKNFYMCKVGKDFVIDATFKGNACRFFNHSCQPNCRLEKWQVNGKTRLGVFASQAIKVGMPLTYNYRFSTSFGPEKVCLCEAPNCQGKL